jgi:FlaA1/EpsC-like NDP-sugar epimerase
VSYSKSNKWVKRGIALISDISATVISWLIAGWLSSNNLFDSLDSDSLLIVVMIQCLFCLSCGLYRGVWRFASIPDLIRIFRSVLYGSVSIILYLKLMAIYVPLKLFVIYLVLLITMLSGTRLIFRWYRDYPKFTSNGKRILVVGAGSAGEGLIRDLYRSILAKKYFPVAFVDDNTTRHGCELHGVRVIGACKDIPKLVSKYAIELIIIAIPSASSKRMREIVQYCEESKIPFRTLPGLKDIADGIVKISSLREILLEDLLGREQVDHDWGTIKSSIVNKTILVTGGGGSIGSELCRQICKLNPAKLIIVDSSEFNLYSIDMELKKLNHAMNIHAHLGNVTDKHEIQKLFSQHQPDLVFHVAAYKHVPLLESHLRVAMHNNILGTRIVAELADEFNVDTFVLISTDKAVNPTSIMGATKRASEIFCQALNGRSQTRYITVRFGNVLDSAGSVIPLFRKQIALGGPVTVTHPDITRYFMTIPEAAQLILQATIMTDQAEIFVLDMGEPINIRYLAEQMIKLSGKTIGKDIEIEYTGLRPGEKLYEELFHINEHITATTHPKIKQAKVRQYAWDELVTIFNSIEETCKRNDESGLLELLCELVVEYKGNVSHSNQVIPEINAA